jgi:hypothetical protein
MTHAIGRVIGYGNTRARQLIVVASLALAAAGCNRDAATGPHVDHINLPEHQTWKVLSVQPYTGLEEVELVRTDWPTPENGSLAFALTKEGLEPGTPVCLDHIREIDALWAHPMPPQGGCAALVKTP